MGGSIGKRLLRTRSGEIPTPAKERFGQSPAMSNAGMLFLVGYVITIGIATCLMKVALEDLGAFQINVMMGIAMVIVSVPGAILVDGSLRIPGSALGIGALVAILMAVGSVLYALALARLPAGPSAAIATSYIVVVVVLSALFLKDRVDTLTIVGLASTLGGVAILSFRSYCRVNPSGHPPSILHDRDVR